MSPGVNRYTIDKLIEIASKAFELGIKCVALFPRTPANQKHKTVKSHTIQKILLIKLQD